MTTISPTAQKVADTLRHLGYTGQVVEFEHSTRTAQEAADRVGCQLGQIVKSLVFTGKQSGRAILVLTSGVNRVDEARIGGYAGEAIGRADPDFVRAETGFAIGGVPPVGHARALETFLDEDLIRFETVWAAAGTPNAVFEVAPQELVRMTAGSVCRVRV